MKTVNKYLFLLAAVVFSLTACEKNPERDPSPEDPSSAVAFKSSGVSVEINKQKEALEHTITLFRTSNIDKELSFTLTVDSADDVFVVNPDIKFAAGEKETSIKVTFPSAQSDNIYYLKLSIPAEQQSAYLNGNKTYEYSVAIVNWTDPQVGVLTDFTLPTLYGFKVFSWYVSYIYDLKDDGSFKVRILNPFYKIATGEETTDENGIFPYFIYNEDGDLLKSGDYNINITVDAEGNAAVADFSTGMAWSDGEITIHNYRAPAVGTGIFGDKVAFDIATKQMVVALGGELYNYAGFSFYFNVPAFLADQTEAVVYDADVNTYVGNWNLNGINAFTGAPLSPIAINVVSDEDEDGQYYAITGLHEDAPEIYGGFDEDTHVFSIYPSYGNVVVDPGSGANYQVIVAGLTASGGVSTSSTLDLAPAEDGSLEVTDESDAIGYVLVYQNIADQSDYSFGDAVVVTSLAPVAAPSAPAKARAAKSTAFNHKARSFSKVPAMEFVRK